MMARISKWFLRGIVLLAALIALMFSAAFASAYFNRYRAENLVAALSGIQVGVTTEAEAKLLTRKFTFLNGGPPYYSESSKTEDIAFAFHNHGLWWLHLASPKSIYITVKSRNGIVVFKDFDYIEDPRVGGSVSEMSEPIKAFWGAAVTDNSGRMITIGGNAPSPLFIMKVFDDTSVPIKRRQLDWKFDLRCMTSLGACRDPRRVLYGAMLP